MLYTVTLFNGTERIVFEEESEDIQNLLKKIREMHFNKKVQFIPMDGKAYLAIATKQPWVAIGYEGTENTPHSQTAEIIKRDTVILYVEHYLIERRHIKRKNVVL